MNRIEFMTELAALLQDIPAIERQDAMKYYNDYFDDAGSENEQKVIEELESPAKLAAMIKADLGMTDKGVEKDSHDEYRESGYADTRFEEKETPARRAREQKQEQQQTPPKSSPVLKVILIIAIILVGGPVIIPCAAAIIMVLLALVVVAFMVVLALVIACVAVAVTGLVLFFVGLANLIPEIAVGLALIGTGLILGALGVMGTVISIRLCMVAIPGICRGIVWICRWPFHRKAVV